MAKRTQISDYKKVNRAEDLYRVVKDKRKGKRTNKQKQKQRNRRYEKSLNICSRNTPPNWKKSRG